MFSNAVEKYNLDYHLIKDDCPADPTPQWIRNDAIVRSWLNSVVALELLAMVVDTTTLLPAHAFWTRLSNIYHDNAETCSSYLEQEFHGLQLGSMTILIFAPSKRFSPTSLMHALGMSITNKCLIQNTLHDLRPRLAYMCTLTLQQRPLLLFLDVRSSLLLEELTL
jgi:hypothetical protein